MRVRGRHGSALAVKPSRSPALRRVPGSRPATSSRTTAGRSPPQGRPRSSSSSWRGRRGSARRVRSPSQAPTRAGLDGVDLAGAAHAALLAQHDRLRVLGARARRCVSWRTSARAPAARPSSASSSVAAQRRRSAGARRRPPARAAARRRRATPPGAARARSARPVRRRLTQPKPTASMPCSLEPGQPGVVALGVVRARRARPASLSHSSTYSAGSSDLALHHPGVAAVRRASRRAAPPTAGPASMHPVGRAPGASRPRCRWSGAPRDDRARPPRRRAARSRGRPAARRWPARSRTAGW